MKLRPRQLAKEYYFGDLQYWKLPKIAADALEEGHDGPALRILAGLTVVVEAEMDFRQIDAAFREMGVADAPITRDQARLFLTARLAEGVRTGTWNAFDAAAHLRIHLCSLEDPPNELQELWTLAQEARNAPRRRWNDLETMLHQAFSDFLKNQNQTCDSSA